jgi:hypothetical protein
MHWDAGGAEHGTEDEKGPNTEEELLAMLRHTSHVMRSDPGG